MFKLKVSRINSDTQVIQDCLSTNVSMFIRGSVFIIATIVILFFYSPTLTGVTIGGIIPVLLCGAFFGQKINFLQKKIQDDKAKMSSVADESFGNVRTVKSFSNELEETEKFNRWNEEVYLTSKQKTMWYSGFTFAV